MQKYHDEPKQYKGYLKSALASLSAEAVSVSRRLVNVGAADRTDLLASEIEAQQSRLSLEQARQDEARVWRQLGHVVGEPMLPVQPLAGGCRCSTSDARF